MKLSEIVETKCEKCRYWELIGTSDRGVCRKSPPIVLNMDDVIDCENWNDEIYIRTAQPITEKGDWCGSFSPWNH